MIGSVRSSGKEPQQIAGRFDVESVAGSGGLGVVYRCRDRANGQLVAVKVAPRASAKLRERFLREAEMLSTVTHPNVVRYVGHGLLDTDEPYLAMEWLEGEDLHTRLERAPLALPASIALARHVASALAAAHAVGIVHRDVKPANVLLVDKDPNTPKLIDFGIARAGTQNLTQPGGVMGTPGYMAPEQARGEAMLDARADVFSLGCMLYECLSGRRAFDGDSPMAILAKVLLEEPPPLRTLRPDIPAALEHVVSRMLSKSKEARYASAADVARDLDRLDSSTEENVSISAAPGALTTRERKLLCLLLARRGDAPAKDATLVDGEEGGDAPMDPSEAARALTSSLGTNAEVLLDGSLVVVIEGTAAVDQASRAARAALRLKEVGHGAMRLAIATGRGEISGTMPFGDVVDRACALLAADTPRGVRIDVLTSNLIDGRFRITTDEHGAILLGEVESESVRSLLGRRTPCIGRDREIGTLLALYDEVKEESAPRLALVTGDAGTGKSRLKMEIVDRLREDNPLWLFGGGDVAQPGAPFGALARALRTELGLRPEYGGEERRTRVIARLTRTFDRDGAAKLAPFLAQLAGLPLDDAPDSRLHSARADAMVMGDSLRAAWQDFLEAEARMRPVVLALEDMQWGDRPSMTLALAALRALKSTRLWVLVTARPEIFSVFPDLLGSRGVTHVELGPLGVRASKRLLQELLDDKSEDSVERVALQAGGNPFLLEELARAVAQGRGGELPETVLATAQARLETLSPSVRRVLRAAAVLGDALSEDGLSALLVDLNKDERHARLAELVREDILEPDASMPGAYRFRQVVLREASYASLTAADKKLAHALAAKWLASRGGADPIALATHLERAGKPAEACEHFVAAAEQSLEGQDLEGAIERLTRATACGPEGEMLGEILLLRAETHRWRGEHREVRECAGRSAKLLPEDHPLWLAAKSHEAISAALLGDLKPAEALGTLLSLLLEGGDVSGTVVSASARTAAMLAQFRSTSGAKRLLAALTPAMQSCKNERAVGQVWSGFAADATERDALEDALEFYESAHQSLMRAGDVRNASMARINMGYSLMQLGQYKRAEAVLREGIAITERAGLLTARALAYHNLGMAVLHDGDAAEAEAAEREAIRAFVEMGDKRLIAASRFYLGRILIARGRADEAAKEMQSACAEVATVPAMLPMAMAGLALALLAAGKKDEALAAAKEAMKRTDERKGSVEGVRTVELALAETLIASQKAAEGATVLNALTVDLLDQASRLRDPELRRSFLHDVEDHARAFALQSALAGTE